MCFIVTDELPQTAEFDIIAYKVVFTTTNTHKLKSLYQDYEYGRNEELPEVELEEETNQFNDKREIHKGYHSYNNLGYAKAIQKNYSKNITKVVEVIIPSGSIYYTDSVKDELSSWTQETVSSKIIINFDKIVN